MGWKKLSRNTVGEVYLVVLNKVLNQLVKTVPLQEENWEKQALISRFSTISVDAANLESYIYIWENGKKLIIVQKRSYLQKSSLKILIRNLKFPSSFNQQEVITAYEYVCKDVDKAF